MNILAKSNTRSGHEKWEVIGPFKDRDHAIQACHKYGAPLGRGDGYGTEFFVCQEGCPIGIIFDGVPNDLMGWEFFELGHVDEPSIKDEEFLIADSSGQWGKRKVEVIGPFQGRVQTIEACRKYGAPLGMGDHLGTIFVPSCVQAAGVILDVKKGTCLLKGKFAGW